MTEFKQILLVSGSGRNCGKTTVACNIIKQLKKSGIVYGLKITPHFHNTENSQHIVEEGNGYKIFKETDSCSGKDSSRMLIAGANEVYFIQCSDEGLHGIHDRVKQILPDDIPVVCESGSFANVFQPGLHILVEGFNIDNSKRSYKLNLKRAEIVMRKGDFTQTDLNYLIGYSGTGWTIVKNECFKFSKGD